jgi:hypothetical protein
MPIVAPVYHNNWHTTGDVLEFVDANGITHLWHNGSGTLTLSGQGSAADYETALRTVRFKSTSNDPLKPDRTVAVTVTDTGDVTASPVARNVSMTLVDDKPYLVMQQNLRVFFLMLSVDTTLWCVICLL